MAFRYLLIPGRHHVLTRFQTDNLKDLLHSKDVDSKAEVIWAITSGNHEGTRRNPISGSRRLGIIEAVMAKESILSEAYRITNMTAKPNFAHFLIEDIRLQSVNRVDMNADNTLVVCSTKEVAEQYKSLGYQVNTAEMDETFTNQLAPRPWDIVEKIIEAGTKWKESEDVKEGLDPVCYEYLDRYGLGDLIVEIFNDPLIDSDDGDITTTRDYATYRQAFEDGANRKIADFINYVRPGRILDVGCATGETLKILSKRPELFESDFYGVEAARPLYQICQQRKDSGEFGNTNMFFYQRNIMRSSMFPDNSLSTVITMALTHEIESYLGRDDLVAFIKRMYDILKPGGVYINYDVVGPDNKDQVVYALLNDQDGENPDSVFPQLPEGELPDFLRTLSTKSRFVRFLEDFRNEEKDQIISHFESIDGDEYAVLRHADLCDFLAKKDYFNSWTSEMHERFCFWEYSDWLEAVKKVGFKIEEGTESKQNPWIIENRFKPAAKVFIKDKNNLIEIEQPVTNILLIASK